MSFLIVLNNCKGCALRRGSSACAPTWAAHISCKASSLGEKAGSSMHSKHTQGVESLMQCLDAPPQAC